MDDVHGDRMGGEGVAQGGDGGNEESDKGVRNLRLVGNEQLKTLQRCCDRPHIEAFYIYRLGLMVLFLEINGWLT